MYIFEKALEYIFLPSCNICGKLGEGYLCKKCGKELEKYVINSKETLLIRGNEVHDIISTQKREQYDFKQNSNKNLKTLDKNNIKIYHEIEKFHIFKYKDLVRKLIIQYKFNDKAYLYKTFCEFIVKNKKVFDFIKSYDIILPVPIHNKRKKQRGYNQSELIAKELSKVTQIKCYTDVLIKVTNNKPQSTLSGKIRKENTKNVYKLINFEKIDNRKILIFDDIYTTGATIKACIQELRKANVAKIGVLTLAKD